MQQDEVDDLHITKQQCGPRNVKVSSKCPPGLQRSGLWWAMLQLHFLPGILTRSQLACFFVKHTQWHAPLFCVQPALTSTNLAMHAGLWGHLKPNC